MDRGTVTDALYRAMCALDGDDPGVFNIVAISEPDTRPVANALAAALAVAGYVVVKAEDVKRWEQIEVNAGRASAALETK